MLRSQVFAGKNRRIHPFGSLFPESPKRQRNQLYSRHHGPIDVIRYLWNGFTQWGCLGVVGVHGCKWDIGMGSLSIFLLTSCSVLCVLGVQSCGTPKTQRSPRFDKIDSKIEAAKKLKSIATFPRLACIPLSRKTTFGKWGQGPLPLPPSDDAPNVRPFGASPGQGSGKGKDGAVYLALLIHQPASWFWLHVQNSS